MKKIFFFSSTFIFILVVFILSCNSPKNLGNESKTGDGTQALLSDSAAMHYTKYCSGCHGNNLEKFSSAKWNNDSATKSNLFAIIKYGKSDEGMPAYDTTFTDKEINSLVSYIVQNAGKQTKEISSEIPGTKKYKTEEGTIIAEPIITNLEVPWGLVMLPDFSILYTERKGVLSIFKNGSSHTISGVPAVRNQGQGGLLDVALHPQYSQNQIIYISYSKPGPGNTGTTAVSMAELKGYELVNQKEIFEAQPYVSASHHYAGRLEFDNAGYLYISVGDRGNENKHPQFLTNSAGKIHRLKADGSIPSDNPFYNTPNAIKSIYSFGHRNPQGLALNPENGILWENEHGPMGGDEINIISKGNNYGWPKATYGLNYNGTVITENKTLPGITDPVIFWVPSIAPGGMTFVTGNKYSKWQGNVLNTSLKFNYLNRCVVKNNKIVHQENLLQGIGRMRHVQLLADGYIYVAIENPGTIYRLKFID